jgi:hypothetical protein
MTHLLYELKKKVIKAWKRAKQIKVYSLVVPDDRGDCLSGVSEVSGRGGEDTSATKGSCNAINL